MGSVFDGLPVTKIDQMLVQFGQAAAVFVIQPYIYPRFWFQGKIFKAGMFEYVGGRKQADSLV